jgi:predicted RNase H-like HicB family nuclease
MQFENYKTILYRQDDGSWVAEIPAIPGCFALMDSRESALGELSKVFAMLSQEYAEKGLSLPANTSRSFVS